MNVGRMRGGRRQIVQLDDTNNETTFLARKENKMRVGSTSKKHKPAGLSALGEYYDSTDSEENGDVEGQENGVEPSTSSSTQETGINGKVANFMAEVQSMSASNSPKDMTSREKSLTPPPTSSSSKPDKATNLYRSMFVKGGTEWNKKSGNSEEVSSTEIDELPEEPTTLWQICVDENTQYQYYWNTVTNEVTWTIPEDYTQYLLQYKLYEEQLAKIPQERQDYLNKKKLGLIQSPVPAKPKNQPKPPSESYNQASSSQPGDQPVTETPSERTNTVETTAEMTDPEKQFYSEIEELEKMDSSNGKEENGGEVTPANGDATKTEDIEVDDIDNALEKALEKKKEELKNLESEETVETKPSSKKRPQRQNSPDSSIYTASKSKKHKNGSADWKEVEADDQTVKICSETAETVRKNLVSYEHDESDGDFDNGMLKRLHGVEEEEQEELDIEERREILEGKLEFLSVTRKGLNKLQIMLIELQTRYTDYLKGALNGQYFLQKLSALGKHVEVYEKRAMPEGWTCRWDRTFRLYRYVNDSTGETQWEHPDASVQVIGETMSHRHRHSSGSSKSRSCKSHSSKRSKDKRREERKSSKSSKSRRAERSLSPEPARKSSKSRRKEKTNIESIVENISLGGLLSKNRDTKSDNISISDDATEEVSITTAPPSVSVDEHVESPAPPSYSMDTCEEDSVEEKNPDPEPTTASPKQQDVTSEASLPGQFASEVSTSSTCQSSSSHALPSTTSAVSSSTYHGNGATPVAMDTELDGEPMVSSSEIKAEELTAKESKKKKKEKVMTNTNFALKKKNVSSLVNKWKKVKIEVEKEEKIDEERQLAIRQKLEEWKKEH